MDNVGSAAVLMGAMQYGSGIISSLLFAVFSDGTPFTMAWIIMPFAILLFFIGIWGSRRN